MMYIEDCLYSVLQFMQYPAEKLKQRTYNITAMSFTPEELFAEIRKHVPELKTSYNIDPMKQSIGMLFKIDNILMFKSRWSVI